MYRRRVFYEYPSVGVMEPNPRCTLRGATHVSCSVKTSCVSCVSETTFGNVSPDFGIGHMDLGLIHTIYGIWCLTPTIGKRSKLWYMWEYNSGHIRKHGIICHLFEVHTYRNITH